MCEGRRRESGVRRRKAEERREKAEGRRARGGREQRATKPDGIGDVRPVDVAGRIPLLLPIRGRRSFSDA
jgi:hypothetical protein